MAITLRTDVNTNSANVAQTTGISLTAVSDGASDDLIVVIGGWSDNNGTWDAITGFTEELDIQDGGGDDRSLGLQYKKHTGSEGSSYTLTGTDTKTSDYISGLICAFDGVDTTTAIDVSAVSALKYNTIAPTPPAITTITDGAWVLIAIITSNSDVTAFVPPTGFTLIGSQLAGVDITTGANIALAYKEVATAGAETPAAWSITNGQTDNDHIVATFVIRPSTGGGGGGRIMSSLANHGGLAGMGGIAGQGGGLAG